MATPPNLATLDYKVDRLQASIDALGAQIAALDAKHNAVVETTTRHDEQIKQARQVGGSIAAILSTVIGALVTKELGL